MAKLKRSTLFPSRERLGKGAVAIIECLQEIPCNPCESACPEKAIKIGRPITKVPRFLENKCTGCGICLAHCPGLAIFVVDLTYSRDKAIVQFPHEFLPLPKAGQEVEATDKEGKVIAKGTVLKVRNPKAFNKTPVISLVVSKKEAMEVRGIQIGPKSEVQGRRFKVQSPKVKGTQTRNEKQKLSSNTRVQKLCADHEISAEEYGLRHRTSDLGSRTPIVCRCEEVRESEIVAAIKQGHATSRAIKNLTRTGMGLCQARFCSRPLAQLISESTGRSLGEIKPTSMRPPARPVDLGSLALGKEDD